MDNSLAIRNPELAKQWHETKNGKLTPFHVTFGSNKKAWWKCEKEHEWEASTWNRHKGRGCPYCANKKVCIDNCLATLNPEIARQWHPTKNGTLTPYDVVVGSYKKVWWMCEEGHEWETKVYRRAKHGSSCLYCCGQKTLFEKSIVVTHPNLLKEWHPFKNTSVDPSTISFGSDKKIWWMCKQGHEWETRLYDRTKNGSGCPYCSGRNATIDNCLAKVYPEISKEWHPIKNGLLTPNDVTPKSGRRVWWKCEKGHEWESAIYSRTTGVGCPYCANKRVCIDNCLATLNPEIAKQWHPTKNGILTPYDVVVGSYTKVWWICEKGHEWETNVHNRTKGSGCPYCTNRKICIDNCLATLNSELAKEWHPTKNGTLTPYDVTRSSSKRVWWKCNEGHEWETSVNNRAYGSGCLYCSRKNKLGVK
ncbi:zinc-ribbon domain-containing protein (plasmid) [Bacillus mycoides]|nr:zinc-ribbon domain-containing protein [Bacillus mycoides]